MVMLAVDTSSPATSVAFLDGAELLFHEAHVDARRHAELLAVMVERGLRALGRPRVTAVACGVGPGAYTGLRVGVSSAQAYALGWQVPVYGVCSLDAMALAVAGHGQGPFACAIDARRKEVYWAHYEQSGARSGGPFVAKPGEIEPELRALPWFGEVVQRHAGLLHPGPVELAAYPDAREVGGFVTRQLALGAQVHDSGIELAEHGHDLGATAAALAGHSLLAPLPLYVRRPDAMEPAR